MPPTASSKRSRQRRLSCRRSSASTPARRATPPTSWPRAGRSAPRTRTRCCSVSTSPTASPTSSPASRKSWHARPCSKTCACRPTRTSSAITASSTCASSCAPSRRSWARATRRTMKPLSCCGRSRRRRCRQRWPPRHGAKSHACADSRAPPASTRCCVITWSGCSRYRGGAPAARRTSRSIAWRKRLTIATGDCARRRIAFSSISRCTSCAAAMRRALSSASSGRRAPARRRWARPSPPPSAASSTASRWAVCAMKPRSADIAARMWARCRGSWCRRCAASA